MTLTKEQITTLAREHLRNESGYGLFMPSDEEIVAFAQSIERKVRDEVLDDVLSVAQGLAEEWQIGTPHEFAANEIVDGIRQVKGE